MSDPQILSAIEALRGEVAILSNRVDSALRSGPFAGQKPGGFATPGPVSESDVDAAFALIGDLGDFDTETFVRGWLSRGYKPTEIADAIDATLAPFMGEASGPGSPNPGNPRAAAAYLVTISHGSGGWKQTGNHLRGKRDNPIVSPDPLPNVLRGLRRGTTVIEIEPLVPEVIRRAEEGIDWTGQRRLVGSDLAEAKAILADRANWRDEWKGWRDESLLRALVLTGDLARKWAGSNLLAGPYAVPAAAPTQTFAEYLWEQKKQSDPWPAQDEA